MIYKNYEPEFDCMVEEAIETYQVTPLPNQERFLTFLYVDDNSIDTWLAVKILETCGVAGKIITASNGAEGLKALRDYYVKHATLPHVILVDLMMPIKDGFELMDEIYNHPAFSSGKTKLILITEGLDEEDKKRINEQKVNFVILKPIDKEQILSIINSNYF